MAERTGQELLAQVRLGLRGASTLGPDLALKYLDGCVLLTAGEAGAIYDMIGWTRIQAMGQGNSAIAEDATKALALLSGDKETT